MAVDTARLEELLKRPLYVYDLPQELLESLSPKNANQQPVTDEQPEPTPKDSEVAAQEAAIATSTQCSLCKVSYQNVQEQRSHVRSDHHRYNLKAQLRGNAPLDEVQFAKAVGELDESISGSESSESEDEVEADGGGDTTLAALLKKQAKLSHANDEETEISVKPGSLKHPLFWLSSSKLPSNKSLGIYRTIFSTVEQAEPDHLVDSLRRKQLAPIKARTNNASTQQDTSALSPHIFMCMMGGGHFAAMLVSLAPEIHRKQGSIDDRQARVIAHKTFHRYTTRRKQGGSQSASDASRGAAHSAGSSLRRYNEAALEKDVRELLADWRQMIDSAELLFIRATGKTNRKTLFGQYDGQVLRQNDRRIRGFPFNTRRATQGELMRCFKELTRVKVSEVDEAALAAAAAAAEAKRQEESSKPSTPRPQPQKPKLSPEEEAAQLHTTQVQAFIRRSKIPALMTYITNNSIPATFTFQPTDSPQNFRCPSPLHFAANLNAAAVVIALLTRAASDPTAVNGEGRTPFELAGDRATRDAFRVARYELGESKWDWNAAKVPSPVSKADADSRAERERKAAEEEEKDRRKADMDRIKQEDAERAARQASSKPGGRTLGTVEKTAAEKRDEETRGMTPEMRMRLERERRARAAEERMRRMK